VRLAGLSPGDNAQVVPVAFQRYGSELPGKFAVITRRAVRIRSAIA
jgi:hypothetical protein